MSTRKALDSIRWFDEISIDDVAIVGGKNASLGEMYRELGDVGVAVPNGFATTSQAFHGFLESDEVGRTISDVLDGWDGIDVDDLTRRAKHVRSLILATDLDPKLRDDVVTAYRDLSNEAGIESVEVAVRSSATAEDLPEASFAGQQETFLMVHGEAAVLEAVKRCFASLYTARAISYRRDFNIDETGIALSACVQRMVRADQASSGVIFTLDTDSGHRGVVHLTAAWGLGENIVQGKVIPDEYHVHKSRLVDGFTPIIGKKVGAKELRMFYDARADRIRNEPTTDTDRNQFCLDDDEVLQLARWALAIEDHYTSKRGVDTPMDIEWAKDGLTNELFIVQARPETVHSQQAKSPVRRLYHLRGSGDVVVDGLAIGDRIAAGVANPIENTKDMGSFQPGQVLVAKTTDPDWEPVMKRASALVTEGGGRTSHAAIVARELGIPAVVGANGAMAALAAGQTITVSCAEGETGRVYEGTIDFDVEEVVMDDLPDTTTDIMINLGDPSMAYQTAMLPAAGIGLARMEFVFAAHVGVHPRALLEPEKLSPTVRAEIENLTASYVKPADFLVDQIALGAGTLAGAFWPRPVILRFSDFKTNEYAGLLGGDAFEPQEENPMIGWRGASRYNHPDYRRAFELELEAVRRVRLDFGLTNLKVMVPFCRTPEEGRAIVDLLAQNGLVQGEEGLEVYVMTEIPSNVFLADEFAEVFDGFSIGSNDLTQLMLGVDRDSTLVASLFDERNPAVMKAFELAIEAARRNGKKIGICGQAPTDHPEVTAFLVKCGIDSISVSPDALLGAFSTVETAENV